MIDCESIFKDYLINCFDEIQVNTALSTGQEYKWIVTDKFDIEYSGTFIADSSGGFVVPLSAFPDGIFTQYSGDFILRIYKDGKQKEFKVAAYPYQYDTYDAISFYIKQGGAYSFKNNLGC